MWKGDCAVRVCLLESMGELLARNDEPRRPLCPGESHSGRCRFTGRILTLCADSHSQVKYFKEKRVMEYNRDKTIERIKQEDAQTVAELKAQGRTVR